MYSPVLQQHSNAPFVACGAVEAYSSLFRNGSGSNNVGN